MNAPTRRPNDIRLWTNFDAEHVSNFRLYEFENAQGLTMVHASVLESLELLRRHLCHDTHEEVYVIITDAIRTQDDLERLALRYGWTDDGGTVSPRSKHLVRFGGIAVDLIALTAAHRVRIPQQTLGRLCRLYFDWVKDDYLDGHVHADNRHCTLNLPVHPAAPINNTRRPTS